MTTTLSEGVKVPDVGSVNWAGDLEVNWNLLNGALANLSGNVKLDRDNTWTGEQSFTLPIVGSITGTASKAIADEDGTSIKTGYVNVAGNQTVSGQKTWSGNQFFTSPIYPKNTSYEIGNTPASNVAIPIYFTDKNNVYTGYVRNVILTTGRTQTELYARNKFTSGALSPTGTDVTSTLQVEVQSNGDKTLYFDGSIRNNVLPNATNTYSLGSSSYQWSSVYAQSYYYNGTAWGLDKANVWTQSQTISINLPAFTLQDTIGVRDTTPANARNLIFSFLDKNGDIYGFINRQHKPVTGTHLHQVSINNGTYDYRLQFYLFTNGASNFAPSNDGVIELGTSTNKWKTLNGVNPGALSLPDLSNAVSIDTTNWSVSGGFNSYTPVSNGWICVSIKDTATSSIFIFKSGGYCASAFGNGSQGIDGRLAVMLPVIANQQYTTIIKAGSSSEIFYVKFIPAFGNV